MINIRTIIFISSSEIQRGYFTHSIKPEITETRSSPALKEDI